MRTFAYSIDDGAPVVVFEGLPRGRAMYPAVFARSKTDAEARWRILGQFNVPHVGLVLRSRVMCQEGRARAAGARGGEIGAWLCERAPLWVVVHVCALLQDP